ncbi:hypothetical protein WISP_136832 [Willisornis vidua]|uniref:Uncharacterized protein n=1 Tax=Willisornis vidua TaxID=1566151 RepID=A0ABQ9CT09_9PASS|nr:hypothetical protein WISP_136832 [Willisornis vidua]
MVTLSPLPGQPIAISNHLFCEEILPNVQPKPTLAELNIVSSSPINSCLRAEANPDLVTTSFQVVVDSGPFPLGRFPATLPQTVVLYGIVVAAVQDLVLGLVEPHTNGFGPSVQPVQVPLQSPPTLWQIDAPT